MKPSPTTPIKKQPNTIPTSVQLKSIIDWGKWSPPDPAMVIPTATECKPYFKNPNVCILRSIGRERKKLPTSQSKVKRLSLVKLQEGSHAHLFYPMLRQWGIYGVPVNCGPDWEWEVIKQAITRGPHIIALDPENVTTVKKDIQYQVESGLSQNLLWEEVKKSIPQKLKVSPMTVVPQNNRRGWIIL